MALHEHGVDGLLRILRGHCIGRNECRQGAKEFDDRSEEVIAEIASRLSETQTTPRIPTEADMRAAAEIAYLLRDGGATYPRIGKLLTQAGFVARDGGRVTNHVVSGWIKQHEARHG